MLIIAGHVKVPAGQRRAFVEAHADLVRRARAYPGCLDEDPVDPSRVNLMELWTSQAVLQAWRKISNPPKTDIKFEEERVQKHHIVRSGPPF
jgi:quinol monooxygenase YgiN